MGDGQGKRESKNDSHRDLVGRRCTHTYDRTSTGHGTIVDVLGIGPSGDPVVGVRFDLAAKGSKPHPCLLDELVPLRG